MTDGIFEPLWEGYDLNTGFGFSNGIGEKPSGLPTGGAVDLAGTHILYVRLIVIQSDQWTSDGGMTMLVRWRWEFFGYRPTL